MSSNHGALNAIAFEVVAGKSYERIDRSRSGGETSFVSSIGLAGVEDIRQDPAELPSSPTDKSLSMGLRASSVVGTECESDDSPNWGFPFCSPKRMAKREDEKTVIPAWVKWIIVFSLALFSLAALLTIIYLLVSRRSPGGSADDDDVMQIAQEYFKNRKLPTPSPTSSPTSVRPSKLPIQSPTLPPSRLPTRLPSLSPTQSGRLKGEKARE
eukprot:CAMPEP_0198148014 /NCGR_PEP_ID=MMETSP1443-20131203/39155_1 /TAXON_ID=186043 /ORGANISM="Entomoneis sp., Strain CCMP2396" /LENGTH=211 /DNA_ID=CAMNT_0043812567 /DNA_START=193 /DNA_END=828 /DNA_ORIENTATION=-